jgi:hypothetical protein
MYPETLWQLGLIVVFVGYYAGPALAGRSGDINTLNVARVSEGAGCLADIALVLYLAASEKKIGGGAALLRWLLMQVHAYNELPWQVIVALLGIALLCAISLYRILAGLRGPFPQRQSQHIGGELLWLALGAAAWIYGLFVPEAWGFGWVGDTFNLALKLYFLFIITGSCVVIALALGGGGGDAERMLTEHLGRRNAPMVGAKRRQF